MLEGTEFEKTVGPVHAVVDVTPDLKLNATVQVQVDIVEELKKLAAKTKTPMDDKAVAALEWVKGVLTVVKA